VSIILSGSRFVLKCGHRFDLVAEAIFGTGADRSGLGVLAWSWVLILAAKAGSLRFAHFGSCQLELGIDLVVAWSRFRIFDFVAIFRPHGKSGGILVNRVSLQIVVARAGSECLPQRVNFRFRTHGYFRSRFAVVQIIVPGAGNLV